MALTVSTAPTVEPVSIQDAKAHENLTACNDDALLNRLIIAARQWIEKTWNVSLCTQTLLYQSDSPPCSGQVLLLPRSPVASVSSIAYTDINGTNQTWSASDYQVDTSSKPARLAPAYDESWPSVRPNTFNAFRVTYVAGYGVAADVPAGFKQAILMLAGHWFVNREAVLSGTISKEVEFALTSLRWAHGLHWIG